MSEVLQLEIIEAEILDLIKDLSRLVPQHIEKWKDAIIPLVQKTEGVSNLTQQLRAIIRVKVDFKPIYEGIKEPKECLKQCVLECIEEDLKVVREAIDKMSKMNTLFRDKLEKLEATSLLLDWESGESALFQGSPTIPPVGRFLQDALAFYTFFDQTYKNLLNSTKAMQFTDEDTMKSWEHGFAVNLDNNDVVNRLLAITQYVDNVVLT